VAIVLGAVVTNSAPLPEALKPGLDFAARRLLRVGVALLGLQLLLTDILHLGAGMLVVVVATVAVGIVVTLSIGRRLGLSSTQRLLIACGFSICGAAAVAAVDGVIEAEEEEVVTAVALVVVFGALMIPLVPLAGHALGLADPQIGLWAGGSIHEVAQVVAAGGAVGGTALSLAVVVKLARVLLLAPVMAMIAHRQRRGVGRGAASGSRRPPLVPFFVLAFLLMAVIRSTGLLPASALDGAKGAQTALLAAAMFALGCGVRLATMRRVGGRPVVLAALSTVTVAGCSLAGVLLVS